MAKVLKVTKEDKTVHIVPLANKPFYLHLNNRVLNAGSQMKLEEIDEKDAENLPYFDETYVTGTEAQGKVSDLQKEIAALKAQLAAKNDSDDHEEQGGEDEDQEDEDEVTHETAKGASKYKRKKA